MTIRLRQETVSIGASVVTAQALGGELDWKFDGTQNRRVVVTLANSADSVLIEGTLDGTNWFTVGSAVTGTTTPTAVTVSGPVYQLRATKTGTNGAASVVGLI